jgi:hypothetical protein
MVSKIDMRKRDNEKIGLKKAPLAARGLPAKVA